MVHIFSRLCEIAMGSRLNSWLLFVYTELVGSRTSEMGPLRYTERNREREWDRAIDMKIDRERGREARDSGMLFQRTIYLGTFIFNTSANGGW